MNSTPGGDMPYYYTSDDVLPKVFLVGAVVVFTGLFLVMGRLDRGGTLTPQRRRWIWVGIAASAAFMVFFAGVLKIRHPDMF